MMLKLILTLALVAGVLFQVALAGAEAEASAVAVAGASKASAGAVADASSDSDNSDDSDDSDDGCEPEPEPKPKCKKRNEVYEICPARCPYRTCGIDDRLVKCAAPLKPGNPKCPKPKCRCAPGFFRDSKGNCVCWEDCCTSCPGLNEVYDPCDAPCPARRCDFNAAIVRCKAPPQVGDDECLVGCRCKDGYLRNNKGVCVEKSQCPLKCTKQNEEYVQCPDCSPQTCSTIGKRYNCPLIPADPSKCKGACRCKKGYARNVNGDCVPVEDCNECPKNEHYEKCPANISGPKNCSEAGFQSNSPESNESDTCPGKPGCVCNDGFLRNEKGVCVDSTDCPSCGGDKNATLGCGVNCGRLCSNYKQNDIACIQICYTNACDCRKDYVYDSNTKQCVLPQDCTPVCKENEKFSTCINGGCDKKKCEDLNKPKICIDPLVCKVGCVCADGYLRAQNGTCVKIEDCGPQCKENEEYSDCAKGACRLQNCSQFGAPIPFCPKFDTSKCKPGCLCKNKYLRNTKGQCIPQNDCPEAQCKPNEEYLKCGLDGCSKRYCSDLDLPQLCRDTFTCTPACECKEGFLRASTSNDTCVPVDQCPRVSCNGDINAKPGCGNHCGNRCSDLNKTEPIACTLECNLNGCDCKDGYVFDDNTQLCVKPADCTKQCPKNEILAQCPQALCAPKTCEQAGYPIACPRFKKCPGKPACVCADGFLRNSDGICIPKEKCPSCGGDVNAKPGCGENCGQRCSTYNATRTKPAICHGLCNNNGCDCRKGFVLDDNTQQCVKPKNCTKPCGVNEEFSSCSNGLCRVQDCAKKGQSRPCPPMVPGSCLPGCVCPVKFLRSKNGTCVPEDQCDVPPEPTCPTNERLSQCPDTECEPKTCKQAGFPVPCPVLGPDGQCPGKPGCVCVSGYLRNDAGVCVQKNQCPSCRGDKNAIPGCGVNCGRLCSNYNSTRRPLCVLICNLNGCDCKKDFVFDGNLQKCVLPEKCTPICQPTEVFNNCTNALCRQQKCINKGKPVACPAIAEGSCVPGCVCPENYLRAENGTCIPEDQCPPTCPEGENYETCPPPKCDGEYCPKTRNDPQTCPYPNNNSTNCGKPRCVCGFNSHRDRKSGKCVATSSCPPFKCDGPNESFNSCVPTCPGETCDDYLRNATCPRFRIGIVVPCKLGCRCDKGYYRDSRNICIPGPKCKSCGGSPTTTDKPTTVKPTTVEPTTVAPTSCDNAQAQQKALEEGNTEATGKIFYQVVKDNPGKSSFVSVFSMLQPCAALALYSNGGTFNQLASLLNIEDKSDIRCGYPGLLASVKATNGTILNVASKIYVYDKGDLSDSLKDDSKNVSNLKQKVSDATNGKIKDLVNADMFDDSTRLALINAIYFKGIWKYKFNANNTKPRDFHVSKDKTTQLATMTQKGRFRYGELSDPSVQVLELPYQDDNLTLLVILPTEVDGLLGVTKKMQDPAVFNNIINSLSSQVVTVYIPKVDGIETTTDVKDALQKVGVTDLFDSSKVELNGMTDPDQPLVVSEAIQKALFSMNEEGAVAAAATGVIVNQRNLPLPPPVEYTFDADHPFIFLIKGPNNLILFAGSYDK